MTTSKSKALGTAAETAVVNAALAVHLVARRTPLAAGSDVGDVHISYGRAVVQVKAGKAAETASTALCAAWWAETEAQADRVPECDLAVLVVKRRGVGQARGWRAFVRLDELAAELATQAVYSDELDCPPLVVELPFGMLLDSLAGAGWVAS